MKSHKLLTLVSLGIVAATVCSCSGNSNQRRFREQDEVNTNHEVIKLGEKDGYPCPSLGKAKVFVVPIEFTDYKAEDIGKLYNSETKDSKALKHYKEDGITPAGAGRGAENAREDIRKVYFGEENETGWHSLRSYYKSSSYGNLEFEGLVSPWITAFTNPTTQTPLSAKEFCDNGGTARTLAQNILTYYTDDLAKKYEVFKDANGQPMFKSGKEFLKYFDSNGDGCFDLLEMVYAAPFYATYTDPKTGKDESIDNETFWAYCGGTGTDGDTRAPKLSKWAWQSYYTTVEGGVHDNGKWRAWTCEEISNGVAKVDAHTIVHETGHGLGLTDYYDYDYKRAPICNVDMMAYNIGDHNAYSKSLLGWVDPIVVTGPTTVKIKSFTQYGDCIYIPYRGYYDDVDPKYANTFQTEYLSLELYEPTGVNESDAKNKYCGRYPLCPTQTGIKLFHVDSRLGIIDYSSGSAKFVRYTDSIVSTASSIYVMNAHSNTGSRTLTRKVGSKTEYNWLIEYLGHNEKETVSSIANDNLFVQGDSFGVTGGNYSGYTFNSGKAFGYSFTIDKIENGEATITIRNV